MFALVYYHEFAPVRAPASTAIRHIIFDLDGTLVESVGFTNSADIVLSSGEGYRVFPHAQELVQKLWDRGLAIHFFSGGRRVRNLELLQKLKFPDGRSFASIAASIHNFEDLVDFGESPDHQYFTDRYRKDISKIAPLEEILMLEDNRYFVLDDLQKKRVLLLPVEGEAWWREKRLVWAHQAFDEALNGIEPQAINDQMVSRRIFQGMHKLNLDIKEEMAQHGCTGLMMGLVF